MLPAEATLSALLAPVSVDDFLSGYWLKQHLVCGGSAERFSRLLSWTALNELLAQHWREPFRFRLASQGRDLDPASYADLGGFTPRIRAKDVTDHLRNGATLSFDAIDELYAPLRGLAESFEAFFRGATKINVYAGWRALHGLDLHRDNMEIFILQLDGPKRWLLYGPSPADFDRTDLTTHSVPPPGAVLDHVLRPGEMLYIPRGCYHLAVPMNEPTLHLTVGVKNPRGIDILRWIAERLRAYDIANRDLPLFAGPNERLRYSQALRNALLEGLVPNLIDQYLAETGSNFKPRPSFSLPSSATPELLPGGRDFEVRLTVRFFRIVDPEPRAPAIELDCAGHRYRFPRSIRWILGQLDQGAPLAMSLLVDAVADQLDEGMVRVLLAMLVKEDLVAITTNTNRENNAP